MSILLKPERWAVLLSIIIHGSFYHSIRASSPLDNALDMLYRFRRKELFSSLSAYSRWYIFDDKKLAIMFKRVSYSRFYHCLFHFKSLYALSSDLKIDPKFGVRLV